LWADVTDPEAWGLESTLGSDLSPLEVLSSFCLLSPCWQPPGMSQVIALIGYSKAWLGAAKNMLVPAAAAKTKQMIDPVVI